MSKLHFYDLLGGGRGGGDVVFQLPLGGVLMSYFCDLLEGGGGGGCKSHMQEC